MVRSGGGVILMGGKFIGGKPSSPTELRGKLEGGTRHSLSAGDVFYIPANLPHQIVVDPGQKFDFEMIKLELKPGTTDLAEFKLWPAAAVKSLASKRQKMMDEFKSSIMDLITSDTYVAPVGGHQFLFNYKEGSGLSEIHAHNAEFQIILGGEGSILLGGKVTGGNLAADADEVRGVSLEGATRQQLRPGDVLYIPPHTPHLTQVEPDQQLYKLIIKAWVE